MVVRFGLIGCGYISKKHLKAISACNDARLEAVSDLGEERMMEAVNAYHSLSGDHTPIKRFKDYHKMLSEENVDAVIISTFSGLHAEMAKAALATKKHVILEKPMTLSIEESDDLIDLAEKVNVKLMICHQLRFKPIMQKIKQVIEEGKIGNPYLGMASVRINRSDDYYSSAPWRGKWETDGGMLINQGIHVVDLLQWFLGDVKSVYGEIGGKRTAVKNTEDIALGILNFENDAKGIIEANIVTQPNTLGYSLSLFGEKGTIVIEGPSLNRITRWYIEGEESDRDMLENLLNDNREEIYMYENFIKGVESPDGKVLVNGQEGKKALEIIFALYQSHLTKQTIHYPLKAFATRNMNRKEGQ